MEGRIHVFDTRNILRTMLAGDAAPSDAAIVAEELAGGIQVHAYLHDYYNDSRHSSRFAHMRYGSGQYTMDQTVFVSDRESVVDAIDIFSMTGTPVARHFLTHTIHLMPGDTLTVDKLGLLFYGNARRSSWPAPKYRRRSRLLQGHRV